MFSFFVDVVSVKHITSYSDFNKISRKKRKKKKLQQIVIKTSIFVPIIAKLPKKKKKNPQTRSL